jgi:hypothetical protein
MSAHKFFNITGEVIHRGTPVKMPNNQYVKSAYFVVKVIISDRQTDGQYKDIEDYFSIHTYSETAIYSIREGYIISCSIRRKSNIWIDKETGKPKIKLEYSWNSDTKKKDKFMGNNLYVFETYHLVGSKIEVVDSSNNYEEIDAHNEQFAHTDTPYNENAQDFKYNDENEFPKEDPDDLPF